MGTQIRGQEVQFGTLWEGSQGLAGLPSEVGVRLVNGGEEEEERHPRQRMARGGGAVTVSPLLETRAGQRQEIWGDRRGGLSPEEPKAGQPSGQDSRVSPS